jgi:hypothetical protein
LLWWDKVRLVSLEQRMGHFFSLKLFVSFHTSEIIGEAAIPRILKIVSRSSMGNTRIASYGVNTRRSRTVRSSKL